MRYAWLLLPLAALWTTAAEDPVQLLYPADQSVLAGPARLVLATSREAAPPLVTVDGRALPLQRLTFDPRWQLPGKLKSTAALVGDRAQAALWCALLDLPPGEHVVQVGPRAIRLRRQTGAAAAGWQPWCQHDAVGAVQLDCGGCHALTDGVLGSVAAPGPCGECHDEATVQVVHNHVAHPLARCATCHDPHGTPLPRHLTAPKEVLCARCHEAGHAKE
ncbi:MAG: cytochrome c3 family protein [Fimbriimonadaceae bacterium]|nr:cytochrome c3 family protein [Fimbriimonadaceae bacterium]